MAETLIVENVLQSFAEGSAADMTLTTADQVNNNYFKNPNGDILILVFNGSAGSLNVVFEGVASVVNYNQAKDVTLAVGAGDYQMAGPFHQAAFNNSSGNVIVTIADDGSDALKLVAIKLPFRDV